MKKHNKKQTHATTEEIIYFTAYAKIYGKDGKKLAETFQHFETNVDELTDEMLSDIEEYLCNRSGLSESVIDHTVMHIMQDEE